MHEQILARYFTDNQIAAILDISVGGLRNKLYRRNPDRTKPDSDLPPYTPVAARVRLWSKDAVRAWLIERYQGDAETVELLMAQGERTARKPERKDAATSA